MKAPRNTQRETQENPLAFLLGAIAGGSSNAIEIQEADGQRSFVGSDTLPTDMRDAKPILEAAGIEFLGPIEGDPMFQYVELPEGWKKVPTNHSMWSDLVDQKGRKRAAIFYKAAFYDRSAHLALTRRFDVCLDYNRSAEQNEAVAHVKDGDTIIYSTEPTALPQDRQCRKRFDLEDDAVKDAEEWLTAKYPDWKNPGAYWD